MINGNTIVVGTGVGRIYWKAINERYEASFIFKEMIHELKSFWAMAAF